MICGFDEARKVGFHESALDRRPVEDLLVLARLRFTRREEITTIGDRPEPPAFSKRHMLEREHHGREIVERLQDGHSHAEIAVLAARMNLVPSLRQEGANARRARGEADEVAVEDEQLREYRERPQIKAIAEKLLDRDEFGREIDRAAVESEERRRKEPLGPRHELHELEVVGELEVRTARIGVRNRGDQGREVERLHGRAPSTTVGLRLCKPRGYHSA